MVTVLLNVHKPTDDEKKLIIVNVRERLKICIWVVYRTNVVAANHAKVADQMKAAEHLGNNLYGHPAHITDTSALMMIVAKATIITLALVVHFPNRDVIGPAK